MKLDKNNLKFNDAVDLVANGEKLIYLTGRAGSGKTTFLKYIREITDMKTIVLAPTGVAALNAGGQTIHSFFKIAPSIYLPGDFRLRNKSNYDDEDKRTIFDFFAYRKNQRNLFEKMELLIIDEVSMVRCDLLDVVDKILRTFRDNENEVFGGVQTLLIGDAFQLPPIVSKEHWELLGKYYKSPFFFDALAFQQRKPKYIELEKIYRQTDEKFIHLLNKVRINKIEKEDLDILNSRFIPSLTKNENLEYITIATHNRLVDNINNKKLDEIEQEEHYYEAIVNGEFPESIFPTEKHLKLKVGAQVMFIKNDTDKKYYNGKIGKIVGLNEDKLIIELANKSKIELTRHVWDNIKFIWNEKEKKIEEEHVGEFIQFPIKLAWSITVHKCQGLTFDNIIADISSSFVAGQVYVALSRCVSLEGILLKSKIQRSAIKTDPNVVRFAENGFS
ncbi:MAG TPA: AAA family ATPase [Candidatus Kapabacteria bacterium]|nr:AAA family ATPase [Candidatus Kapabacteria bacterium]